jgi:putative membrane protein
MSEPHPYSRFSEEELILRDHLAVDRTVLANERTLLAYVRTALALGVVGASCLHFLGGRAWWITGVAFLVLGGLTFGVGVWRYRKVRALIRRVEQKRA